MDDSLAMMTLIGLAVWLVLGIIGDWMLFRKAGRPGILSLIPGVNLLVEFSICWSWFFGLIFFLLIGGTNYFYGAEQTAPAGAAGVVAAIIHWVESQKLARSFGKGFGYGLLLFFFGRLARVILGLSSAEYVGKY
jgi:hypothetical protein